MLSTIGKNTGDAEMVELSSSDILPSTAIPTVASIGRVATTDFRPDLAPLYFRKSATAKRRWRRGPEYNPTA